MSGTHSTAMAEERLFPSIQTHKSTVTTITGNTKDASGELQLMTTVLGEGPGKVEPLGAFEVPRTKRLLQIGVAVVYCLLAAGIIFGYAALKPILIAEGVYRDRCTPSEATSDIPVCLQQEIALNLMFTIAAVATNVCALLVGTVLDQYGPRVSGIIGSFLFACGCLGFAFAEQLSHTGVDPYIPAYLLLAIGGPFIFIPSFHLANAFPRRSGLVLSMLTGAFDSSSAVFLGYQLFYDHFGGLSLRTAFLGYLVVPALILLSQFTIMPSQSYKTATELSSQAAAEQDILDADPSSNPREREAVISEIDSLLGPTPSPVYNQPLADNSGILGALHHLPLRHQLRTFWFIGIAAFTILQMTRINYFVATISSQYTFLLPSRADSIVALFNAALPLGGIAAIPFIGATLDSFRTLTVLSALVFAATLIGALGLFQNYSAAVAGVLLFTLYRPFYYTVVSDYCVKVFGVATFGKVYGAVICAAGLIGLGQAGLDRATHEVWGGDPRMVNAGLMGAALVVGIGLVGYVARQGKAVRRKKLGQEAMRGTQEEQALWPQNGEWVRREGYGGC
ncbi:major facilitator superfamily domain-containing protein [Geopyxis carbonaria]|nr:major facilitator superfamily domain-containing protein [Geopyxis carbonaria]